ncbi:porin [Leucothrix arctica]|nr:porin [Leucothrix arctica]
MKSKCILSISRAVLAGLAFSGLSASAQAAYSYGDDAQVPEFSYNFVEGAYDNYDFDGLDADIGRLSMSYDVASKLNIIGEYANGDIDNPTGGSSLDYEAFAIGLGYHTPVAPRTDVTANIKYINQDIDSISDDDGYGVGIGLRHKLMGKVELDANIDYMDLDDNDDTRFGVGARYDINNKVSVGVDYSTSSEDVDIISSNIRFNF